MGFFDGVKHKSPFGSKTPPGAFLDPQVVYMQGEGHGAVQKSCQSLRRMSTQVI